MERMKSEFIRLVYASTDIRSARETFELIIDSAYTSEQPITQSLLAGAIVSYAKPFIGNSEYGSLQGKIVRITEIELQKMHKRLVQSRNKIIAHNDKEHVKIVIIPPGSIFSVNEENLIIEEISYAVKSSSMLVEDVHKCIELCNFFEARLLSRIVEIKDNAFENETLPKAPFELKY
ncbi:hypothetical protein ACRN9Z_02550 [Shewanella frigidimarina]|uniref:hypothetical protein n=1 Tax=Shewanella frigidimarina TaxID=56812 RepID=UPI003D7AB888